jgi:hypothetical protein
MPGTARDRRIAYERLLLDALHGNQALFVSHRPRKSRRRGPWIDEHQRRPRWRVAEVSRRAPYPPAPGARRSQLNSALTVPSGERSVRNT